MLLRLRFQVLSRKTRNHGEIHGQSPSDHRARLPRRRREYSKTEFRLFLSYVQHYYNDIILFLYQLDTRLHN